MIRFECDYAEGMHPEILKRLVETNDEQTIGYMEDEQCAKARAYIKRTVGREDVDVHFITGGTQANLIVCASILRPYQGAVCANTGHINCHETGAVEATGHKVLPLDSVDGTISAAQVDKFVSDHFEDGTHEHIVQPGMVYISFPTENGTLYSKQQLRDLYDVCKKWNIPLFIDGARLGYALASKKNDLTIQDIAQLCDVFYIGGTKVGAMLGEAVVICNPELKKDFRYMIKQRGAMLAKGRFIGIQFETLFENGLYFEIAKNAMECAEMLTEALEAKGYRFLYPPQTNQLFPILSNEKIKELQKEFAFNPWGLMGEKETPVRFCTSWATKKENVEKLIKEL